MSDLYYSEENLENLSKGKAYNYLDLLKDVEKGVLPVKDVAKGVVQNRTRGYWERIIGPFELISYKISGFLERYTRP
jgi:hypothetical protein